MYIWYSPATHSSRDGDGLKDDVYGGSVTQGTTIEGGIAGRRPGPYIWYGMV